MSRATRPRTTIKEAKGHAVPYRSSSSNSATIRSRATKTKPEAKTQQPLSQSFPARKVARAPTAMVKSKAASSLPLRPSPPALPILSEEEIRACTTIPHPRLSFSLSQGIDHLIQADPRFERLLQRIPLRVFEELTGDQDATAGHQPRAQDLDLFRTLVTSIVGQQVSWLAARSILYKFTRLWFPDLPEKPDFAITPRDTLPFPTPLQVRSAGEAMLRSAGLSGQKVRYVTDIAERFSDGRLDVRRIVDMDEDEVSQELVKIKGVGPWTAQMLLLFALRRPNILPVGDLGVQRGMVLLWSSGPEGPLVTSKKAKSEPASGATEQDNKIATVESQLEVEAETQTEAAWQAEEASKVEEAVEASEHHEARPPSPLSTPSAKDTSKLVPDSAALPPIPSDANLTLAQLKARKNGQKAKGNVYLTPAEMEALAKSWAPYRSLASIVMWALVDS